MSTNAQKSAGRKATKDTGRVSPKNTDPLAAAIAAAQAEAVPADSLGQRGRPKGSDDAALAKVEDAAVAAMLAAVSGQADTQQAVPVLGILTAVLTAEGREMKTQPGSLVVRKTFREKVKAAGLTLGQKAVEVDGEKVKVPHAKFRDADTVEG